jgi:UPF0755 protein
MYLLIPIKSPKIVYIPQGSAFKSIAHLQEQGVGLYKIDVFILRLLGFPQHGWINIPEESLSRIAYLSHLTTAKAVTQTITLIPGETTTVFLDMRLQMDGTLNYGEYSHQKVTAKRIRTDKTAYNTYKRKGLPEDPVCTVSREAIKAALAPKKSDYLYFVRGKNGEHVYSSYFSTHHKNILNATK